MMTTKEEKKIEKERRAKLTQAERDAEDVAKNLKKEEEPKIVELKQEDYDKLMRQLERNAKDIDLLIRASDKERMSKALGDTGEILIKKVRIWTWAETGTIVVASKLIVNRSEIIEGKPITDQQVTVVLEGGETMTVPYLEFYRKTLKKIPADIIGTREEYDSENKKTVIFKVQFANGKKLEINSAFVN